MLDVHPPHEPVHGWRDFLLHIATITIGLLIALGLEAAAEWIHHRHLVAEARENLRREIAGNRAALPGNLASLQGDAARMRGNILVVRQLRDHPHAPHGSLHFDFGWTSFSDSAWQTARDTGALAYMPYDELQQLSGLYAQQSYINSLGTTLFTSQGRAPAIIASENSIEDLQLDQLAILMGNITTLTSEIEDLQKLIPDLERRFADAAKLESR